MMQSSSIENAFAIAIAIAKFADEEIVFEEKREKKNTRNGTIQKISFEKWKTK